MAKQSLNLGTVANDNTGDTLRGGGDKINDNFNEIYSAIGNGTNLQVSVTNPAVGQVLRYNGSSFLPSDLTSLTAALDVNGNSIGDGTRELLKFIETASAVNEVTVTKTANRAIYFETDFSQLVHQDEIGSVKVDASGHSRSTREIVRQSRG